MVGLKQGIGAFRREYLTTGAGQRDEWSSYEGRRVRYALLTAMLENAAYDSVNKWAHSYKTSYGLYRWSRNIYNPAHRLATFHSSHIWGGRLAVVKGEAVEDGALPIKTESAELRKAIAGLWRASNWQSQKDVTTLRTSALGDGALMIRDDVKRKRVYLEAIHPATIKHIDVEYGNVKGYYIERVMPQSDKNAPEVIYGESAERDGEDVVYQTFKNGQPFDWGNGASEWRQALGFVPMVMLQHVNVGETWGWSEIHAALSKVREVDDIASKTSDQIRKMVDAPWLFAGATAPDDKIKTTSGSSSPAAEAVADAYSQEGRQEIPTLYGPVGATATPLVAPLNLESTINYIDRLNAELEKEFPELRYQFEKVTGDISGRALRIARQDTTTKMQERRTRYDAALVRAHQMAIAIGGMQGYVGYEGFDLGSYNAGKLDHEIGDRPVFADDEMDKIETEKALWDAAGAATSEGVPLEVFLTRQGWTEDEISKITGSEEYKARQTVAALGLMQPRNTPPGPNGQNNPAQNDPAAGAQDPTKQP